MSKLLILDLDGVLCCKKGKEIIFRPDTFRFIEEVYSKYNIGFFTSCTYKTMKRILGSLLTEQQDYDTIFKWSRDHTHLDNESPCPWDTYKLLSDVWDNPVVNPNRYWNKYNTLMIDDSPNKMRYNPPENWMAVRSFNGEDDSMLEYLPTIDAIFSSLETLEKRVEDILDLRKQEPELENVEKLGYKFSNLDL